MSVTVREANFDVVIAAGPRVNPWPSTGVRALSSLCAEMGLTVGVVGGDSLQAKGVIPLPGPGGLLIAEDKQKRIYRISSRAIVRVTRTTGFPDPFMGWYSPGLIPIQTALKLFYEGNILWTPAVAILGSGNEAFRFGSLLLEKGVPQVFCIESMPHLWKAKRYAGWEVEKRRFEILGGKLIEATPIQLNAKSPLLWEFKLRDLEGVRVLEVSRVIGVGPYQPSFGVREHPPGSFLFELEQTALADRTQNIEGWALEEERGRWLAGRILRLLVPDLGDQKEELEKILKRARHRLKKFEKHLMEPFLPAYQGKWIVPGDAKKIKSFTGVPQAAHQMRGVASIECFEDISCQQCQKACPENAIDMNRGHGLILSETDCTACGLCLVACPSQTPLLIHESSQQPMARLTFSWKGKKLWEVGDFAQAVNRRGQALANVRVTKLLKLEQATHASVQLVEVEVPAHLVWEARGLRRLKPLAQESAEEYTASIVLDHAKEAIEVTFDGEKRLIKPGVPLSVALFETGHARACDTLLCQDGSCGLCEVEVDGSIKLACQTQTHRGMSIKLKQEKNPALDVFCPCLNISKQYVVERVNKGQLQSPEVTARVCQVGEGGCHGQICREFLSRLTRPDENETWGSESWIDWRFPWLDWTMSSVSSRN